MGEGNDTMNIADEKRSEPPSCGDCACCTISGSRQAQAQAKVGNADRALVRVPCQMRPMRCGARVPTQQARAVSVRGAARGRARLWWWWHMTHRHRDSESAVQVHRLLTHTEFVGCQKTVSAPLNRNDMYQLHVSSSMIM